MIRLQKCRLRYRVNYNAPLIELVDIHNRQIQMNISKAVPLCEFFGSSLAATSRHAKVESPVSGSSSRATSILNQENTSQYPPSGCKIAWADMSYNKEPRSYCGTIQLNLRRFQPEYSHWPIEWSQVPVPSIQIVYENMIDQNQICW